MAKAKPKATVLAADGTGGMAPVKDRRFESGEWPIRFEVPKDQARSWLTYLQTELQARGWNSSGLSQMEAQENSGSLNVNTGASDKPQFSVVWEWERGRSMRVRSRSTGTPELPLAEARSLFEQVNEKCRLAIKHHFYRRWQLEYEGLPWRGEFWLDDTLRLGPPSRQYETALLGPRIIIVDATVNAISQMDASAVFSSLLSEVSLFLSVVMGTDVQIPEQRQGWTTTVSNGHADSSVQHLGYIEHDSPTEMPARGTCSGLPLRPVQRPDFSLRGIDGSIAEQWLPTDVGDLWKAYRELAADQRRQFQQAAAKWQEAMKLFNHDHSTLSFSLMVVACEALKPREKEFRDHNIYPIVEALLGKAVADKLLEPWFLPQRVRNTHLHSGEFRGTEFMETALMGDFQDPTFDQAWRALARITQESIIESLRRRGAFTLPRIEEKTAVKRWLKKRMFYIVPATFVMGLAIGWLVRTIY